MNRQHNIALLVGNGFDIQILEYFHRQSTTFSEFFQFETRVLNRSTKDNQVLALMAEQLRENEAGSVDYKWSDLEGQILACAKAHKGSSKAANLLLTQVQQLQADFSIFLNEIVTPQLLQSVASHANAGMHTFTKKDGTNESTFNNMNSIMNFSEDIRNNLNSRDLVFNQFVDWHDLYNWNVFNFNYTSILDNYLYLPLEAYNPHEYKTMDTSFHYINNFKSKTDYYYRNGYLNLQVFHPHGSLSVPRSMLFGFDDVDQVYDRKLSKEDRRQENVRAWERLSKPFAVQDRQRFAPILKQCDLFIVFGTSLGQTDEWWWQTILDRMCETVYRSKLFVGKKEKKKTFNKQFRGKSKLKPELIVYWFDNDLSEGELRKGERSRNSIIDDDTELVLTKLREYCKGQTVLDESQVFVVPYASRSDIEFLQYMANPKTSGEI